MFGIRPLPARPDWSKLKCIFGHCIHESLMIATAQAETFLFTGLRNPLERAISEYRHIARVFATAGKSEYSAEDYLYGRQNTMCRQLAFGFPSFCHAPTKGRQYGDSENLVADAIKVLEQFDYIYDADSYRQGVRVVFDRMGLHYGEDIKTNSSARVSTADVDLIRQEFLPRNQADVELFSYGQKHLFNRPLEHVSKKERLQLLDAKYSTVADAKAAFSVHLARALVQSYGLEERRPELVRLIEAEKLWQNTLDYAIEYWSDKPVNSTR